MESQTFAMYAVELRDAVETFNGRRLSLSSVEQFVAAVEQVADRIAEQATPSGGVVMALDTFSRKAVG